MEGNDLVAIRKIRYFLTGTATATAGFTAAAAGTEPAAATLATSLERTTRTLIVKFDTRFCSLGLSATLPAFALFFLGAVAEEIGWQGYAYPRLTLRYSLLQAALIIGVVWALWHIIPFALMGRGAMWIMWHSLGMVLMRIIIVWLFVNTGQSILIAVLFHVMSNSVWGLFTNFDPWYDPLFMCVVLLIAVAAIVWISKYDRRILGVTGPGKQSTLRL